MSEEITEQEVRHTLYCLVGRMEDSKRPLPLKNNCIRSAMFGPGGITYYDIKISKTFKEYERDDIGALKWKYHE
jgi:hypothetical protein